MKLQPTKLILSLLLSCFTSLLLAQEVASDEEDPKNGDDDKRDRAGMITAGITGFYSLNDVTESYQDYYEVRSGGGGGIFGEIGIFNNFSASIGVLYNYHGANDIDENQLFEPNEQILGRTELQDLGELGPIIGDVDLLGFDVNQIDIRFQAIEVPILLHYYPYQGLRLSAGASFNNFLDVDAVLQTNAEGDIDRSKKLDIEDRINNGDISAIFGVGYEFDMKPFRLIPEFRYKTAITDANALVGKDRLYTVNWMFMVHFGYTIDLF